MESKKLTNWDISFKNNHMELPPPLGFNLSITEVK